MFQRFKSPLNKELERSIHLVLTSPKNLPAPDLYCSFLLNYHRPPVGRKPRVSVPSQCAAPPVRDHLSARLRAARRRRPEAQSRLLCMFFFLTPWRWLIIHQTGLRTGRSRQDALASRALANLPPTTPPFFPPSGISSAFGYLVLISAHFAQFRAAGGRRRNAHSLRFGGEIKMKTKNKKKTRIWKVKSTFIPMELWWRNMSVCSCDAFLISNHKGFFFLSFFFPLSAVSHGISGCISLPGGFSPQLYGCCSSFSFSYFNFFFFFFNFVNPSQRCLPTAIFKIKLFSLKFRNAKRPGGEPQPGGRSLETDSSHACTASAWDVHY